MSWKNMISSCFKEDKKFALHESEKSEARKMIQKARSEFVDWDELIKELKDWVLSYDGDPTYLKNEADKIPNRILDLI